MARIGKEKRKERETGRRKEIREGYVETENTQQIEARFFFPEEGKQNSYRLAVKVILRRGE